MADQATIEDAADVGSQTTGGQTVNSSGGRLRTIIPNVTKVGGIALVYGIGAEGFAANSTEALIVNPDSRVSIQVGYPSLDYQVFLRYGNNVAYEVIRHITGAYVSFSIKENQKLIAGLSDGEIIWVELRLKDRPDLSGLISYYLTFQQETPKEQQARKEKEQAEKEKVEDGGVSGGPVDTVMGALGDTMGGIVGSTIGASSVGGKTMSRSGTNGLRTSGNIGPVASRQQASSASNIDLDSEDGGISESTEQQTLTLSSTSEVAGGSQTISQSGTVEQTQTSEISSGGTVSASQGATISGTVSGTQDQTVAGTLQAGGGITATGSGTSTVSVAATPQAGGSGSTAVEGTLNSQTNISGRAEGTSQGQALAPGGAKVEAPVSETTNISQTALPQTPGSTAAAPGVISQGGTAALGLNVGASGTVDAAANQPKPPAAAAQGQAQSNPSAAQTGSGARPAASQSARTPASASSPSPLAKSSAPAASQNAQSSPAPGKGKVDSIDKADQAPAAISNPPAAVQQMIDRLGKNNLLGDKLNLPLAKPGKDPAMAPQSAAGISGGSGLGKSRDEAGSRSLDGSSPEQSTTDASSPAQDRKPGTAPQAPSTDPRDVKNPLAPGQPQAKPENSQQPTEEDENAEDQEEQPQLGASPPRQGANGDALENLAGKAAGEATSKIWWWGFGIAAATFFSGLDFFLGAIIMDAYWVFFYRKNPKLFPLRGYQKFLTVIAHLLPFVWASFFFGIVLYLGCTFPLGTAINSATNFKLSIIGGTGNASVCQAFMSFPAGLSGALNGAVVPSSSPTPSAGSCSVMPSGDASPVQLAATCFSSVATQASMVAVKESGGNPAVGSGTDICRDANGNQMMLNGKPEVVSWGLFQINLTAHQVAGLNCPSAFDKLYTAGNHQCQVINPSLYNQCIAAVENPGTNIQLACQIYQSQGWGAWGAAAQACVSGQ